MVTFRPALTFGLWIDRALPCNVVAPGVFVRTERVPKCGPPVCVVLPKCVKYGEDECAKRECEPERCETEKCEDRGEAKWPPDGRAALTCGAKCGVTAK